MLSGRRYETFTTADAFRRFAESSEHALKLAAKAAANLDILLAVENHKDWRADELLAILKRVGNDHVGICLDTGNSIALLEDPMDVIEALAPRSFTIHFKDMGVEEYREGFLLSEVPLGTGILDLPRAVRILRAARPEIRFNVEMITRDPLRVPCLARRYWTTLPDLPGRHLARRHVDGPRSSAGPSTAADQPIAARGAAPRRRRERARSAWHSHGNGSACSMDRRTPLSHPAIVERPTGSIRKPNMSEHEWNAEAEAMAQYVAEEWPGTTRGVIEGRQARVSVVFGNEAGRDPAEVRDEVARIREILDQEGIRLLGFAVAPGDGETWAMIVESEDIPLLNELVGGLDD